MNELALFAGAGGGILGGKLLGWRTVCAVEYEPHAAAILVKRQNDGILQPFPIWDDVRTFNGKPWQGRVDVVSGGFPCQDISVAGKGAGINGQQSGLWKEMARVICEVRPKFAFVENSPLLTQRGLSVVLGDLAEMGYDAQWGVLGHDSAGGQQKRERIWIVAHSDKGSFLDVGECKTKNIQFGKKKVGRINWINFRVATGRVAPSEWECRGSGLNSRPLFVRKSDGLADGLDRLARIGNGQVPAVVRLAWKMLAPQSINQLGSQNE